MKIDRSEPAYIQIARHYQGQITAGVLREGERLPPIRQIAADWGVVKGTAARAIKFLESAQVVRTTATGTYVRRRITPAPHDRVRLSQSGQQIAEDIDVREAGVVRRPYVAALLGLEDDAEVVRREQVAYLDGTPVALSVHWLPGDLASERLTSMDPIDISAVVREESDRVATHGTDYLESRSADSREADALDVEYGASVLASVSIRRDDQGVIEYAEYVNPARRTVSYQYDLTPPEQG